MTSTDHSLTIIAVLAGVLVAAASAGTVLWVRRRSAARRAAELHDLRQAAYRDPLTGLGNRAAFQQLMAAPDSRRSIVILLNIDNHRQYLQQVGSRAFDEAFTLIAGRVRFEATRAGGHAFRLRRDEIAVVCCAPPRHSAADRRRDDVIAVLAGRLVAAVQAATSGTGAQGGVAMRARAGVATAPGHTEPDGRLVLAHADLALRYAKRSGAAWVRHPAPPTS
ncbi:diguanylate cyclase domain-containing protein [Dactylosporangium cerinum]|uniref:Diguanylate cyclase domain-containing protein n=1 Tax=Dactylosporangium cerinum TaxID=1434730 RepID=A0ABV9WIK8_9ACTN